jgi:glycosyltransferase involved in cell wall biosynthesis
MTAALRVSVCIPTRDRAEHLGTAIASALAQDVDGLEVVVSDDASRDGSAGVAAAFGDPRVHVLRRRRPVGVAANRNTCLEHARGEYIAWLDSDDEYLPGALRRQVAVLDRHPGVVLVHGRAEIVDGDGRTLPSWPAPFEADAIEPSQAAFRQLIAANELTTSTVVARRSAHRAAGPFDASIGASSTDWDMWLRLALHGSVAYTAAPIARYRQHARTISRATTRGGERLRCDLRVATRLVRAERERIDDAAAAGRAAEAALAAKAVLHAGDAYVGGQREEALDALALAGRLAPSIPVDELLDATRRGDDLACLRLTKSTLGDLARPLAGTRFGARVRRAAAVDPAWEAELTALGDAVAGATRPEAVLAVIAKWDPTVVIRARRAGGNYPDRALLPDGYPRDGAEAVAHLEALRRAYGTTHLVVPTVSAWWLEHYPELALHVGAPLWVGACGAIHDARGRL